MKKLAKKLDGNPIGSRCLNVQDCVELVKESKRLTVFIHVPIYNQITLFSQLKNFNSICILILANWPHGSGNDGRLS